MSRAYIVNTATFLCIAVVGLTLSPHPTRADSNQVVCNQQSSNLSNWTVANSFQAAHLAQNTIKSCREQRKSNTPQTDKDFDFDDYPLDRFYVLQLEWSDRFNTGIIQHEISFGLELSKSPIALTNNNIEHQESRKFDSIHPLDVPIGFSLADFYSRKNSLSFYIEDEFVLGKRLRLSVESELELVINDTTDVPDLPSISQVDYEAFSPEVEISYQFNDSISIYANFSYSSLPVTTISNNLLQPEIESGLEVGIETQLLKNKLSATVYFYDSLQKNVLLSSASNPELEVLADEQKNQEMGLEVIGKSMSGWNLIVYYVYKHARITKMNSLKVGSKVPNIAKHSGGFWITYEMQTGSLQGLGLGLGVQVVGSRPEELEDSSKLSGYLQTDVAVFYASDNWKAALNVENLFDRQDFGRTPLTVLGTIWTEF